MCILRYMPAMLARAIEHDRRVVIDARSAALEQRCDDDEIRFCRRARRCARCSDPESARRGRTRRRFRAGRNTARCAAPAAARDAHRRARLRAGRFDRVEVGVAAAAVGFLQQSDFECARIHRAIVAGRWGDVAASPDSKVVRLRAGGHNRQASAPAGTCIVRQCTLPFCQINGRASIGTTSRCG